MRAAGATDGDHWSTWRGGGGGGGDGCGGRGLPVTEDQADLLLGLLLAGGAVDGVAEDVGGKAGPQGVRRRLLGPARVCGPHHGPPVLHRVLLDEEQHHRGPAGGPEPQGDGSLLAFEGHLKGSTFHLLDLQFSPVGLPRSF